MKTVTDLFEPHIGVKEYNGIVATIQRWYYETQSIVRDSWCSTSMSYMLNELGLLDKIGKKQENVYYMMKMCEDAAKRGVGTFYYRDKIPANFNILRGTIVFMLNSDPPMTASSSKHVTSMYENTKWRGSGNWKALGGNQSDMIRVSQYAQARIYAIYIPPYKSESKHTTLRKGDRGTEVSKLQTLLNELGYRDDDAHVLAEDGSFGKRTEEAVKNFQRINGLVVDGVCGPKTWAKLDEKPVAPEHKIKVLTTLNCRKGPGSSYDIVKVLKTGYTDTYSTEENGWIYLKKARGWVNKKYVEII